MTVSAPARRSIEFETPAGNVDAFTLIVCIAKNVCAVASVRAIVALVVGNVITVLSVPVIATLLFTVSVLLSAIVSVEPVAGAVKATLLTVVAEATPRVGVVNDGEIRLAFVPKKSAVAHKNTCLGPALNVTIELALLDAYTVVRVRVFAAEYVPRPHSHSAVGFPAESTP